MKKIINKIFLGKNANVSVLAAFGILSFVLLGCSSFGRNDSVNQSVVNSAPANQLVISNTNTNGNNSANQPLVDSSSTPVAPVETPKENLVKADASKPEMPSDKELQEMTKKTLLDFNKAVKDDDFTDFYDTIASAWKKQTSPSDIKKTFQGFIDKKIDIGNITALEAGFLPVPVIEQELGYKTLKLKGKYPTTPKSTKFLLHFIPDGKDWKLSRIEVDTTGN